MHLLNRDEGKNINIFVQNYSVSLCENLIRFPRHDQIIQQMITEISKPNQEEFDIFVLPDVLVLQLSGKYYYDLLRSCFIEYKIDNTEGINSLSKQILQKTFKSKSVLEKKELEGEQFPEKHQLSDADPANNEPIKTPV